jgi:hypothetical protein
MRVRFWEEWMMKRHTVRYTGRHIRMPVTNAAPGQKANWKQQLTHDKQGKRNTFPLRLTDQLALLS